MTNGIDLRLVFYDTVIRRNQNGEDVVDGVDMIENLCLDLNLRPIMRFVRKH